MAKTTKLFETMATLYIFENTGGSVSVLDNIPGGSLVETAKTLNAGNKRGQTRLYRVTLGGYEGAPPGILAGKLLAWTDKKTGDEIAAFGGKCGSLSPATAWEMAGVIARLVQAAAQAAA